MAFGGFLYLLSTSMTNFLAMAAGLSELVDSEDKLTYVVIVVLSLTLVTMMFRVLKKGYSDQKNADLIYSGFSLINTFVYNMSAYSILVFIAMNHSLEKLTKYYPVEVAQQLLEHYDGISISSLLLLITEMALTFWILKALFNLVCRDDSGLFEYLLFLIGLFVHFYSQYCIENSLIVFTVYLILFFVNYRGKLGIKRKSSL